MRPRSTNMSCHQLWEHRRTQLSLEPYKIQLTEVAGTLGATSRLIQMPWSLLIGPHSNLLQLRRSRPLTLPLMRNST